MKTIFKLTSVHFKSFFREPSIIFWAIFFPIGMAWVLGIAFTEKREVTKTVYVIAEKNKSNSIWKASSEKVFGNETGNPTKIKFIASSKEESIKAIQRGIIAMYLEEKGDSLIYHFDPKNADAQLTHLIIERGLNDAPHANISVNPTKVDVLTTRGTRYIDFLLPGLMALGILNSCIWGIGWNLVELRMKKLLRRMVATPMKKSYFLISLILTRIVLTSIESLILFTFAFLYFGTVVEGSILALALVFLAGIFAFSGVAILIGSRTQNSQIGNGLINAATLPMMILSGIFFNYHNFPEWAVPVIKVLPLTLLADSMRAIFIEGMGLGEALIPILILMLIGAISFIAGLRIFKWY